MIGATTLGDCRNGFVRPAGENFIAGGGYCQGMLPLRGEATVAGSDSPAVGVGKLGMMRAGVEHGFDGKSHALLQLDAGAGFTVVEHLGIFMKNPANAVTAVFAHDGEV